MSIRGTNKILLDEINTPVLKWGFSSLVLALLAVGFLVVGIISVISIGWLGIVPIFIYMIFVSRLSGYFVGSQKKGIMNPVVDRLDYLSQPKHINQSNKIEELYEDSRSN